MLVTTNWGQCFCSESHGSQHDYLHTSTMAVQPHLGTIHGVHRPQDPQKLWLPMGAEPATGEMDGVHVPVWLQNYLHQGRGKLHSRCLISHIVQSWENCVKPLPPWQQWPGGSNSWGGWQLFHVCTCHSKNGNNPQEHSNRANTDNFGRWRVTECYPFWVYRWSLVCMTAGSSFSARLSAKNGQAPVCRRSANYTAELNSTWRLIPPCSWHARAFQIC